MKKIAIIGANIQQIPLIVKAKERGYETHTFAWHDGRSTEEQLSDCFYPISASNKESILAKCRDLSIDAVVSMGSDISALAASYVSESLGLIGNRFEAVTRATNKLLSRKAFADHNIPQPAFVEIGDAVPFDTLKQLRYPLIVKPGDRSGARGIRVINDETEFFSAINEARDLSFERRAIVEEYISGRLYSCECISVGGTHRIVGYTARCCKLINNRPCEIRHTQPAILPLSVKQMFERDVDRILNALGITEGASSIEFIVDESNRVFIIEVSPYLYGDYIGTDLIPTAYGVDLTNAILDIATGIECNVLPYETRISASVEFEYSEATGARLSHRIIKQDMKELGGCPALRVTPIPTRDADDEHTVAFNSEYAAFWGALQALAPDRIHIPYYASATWSRIAEESGVEIVWYHIGLDFLPLDIQSEPNDAVLLINYHGLCSEYIKNHPFKKAIIDHSMAFFDAPVMKEGTYNVYAARKFFPVLDGGYLISASLHESQKELFSLPRDISYNRAAILMKSLELGESAAYKDLQTNEQYLAKNKALMSVLTQKMLASIDFAAEDAARMKNYTLLHNELQQFNLLLLDINAMEHAPQFYPLLADADIRKQLIEKKIYVPLMWRSTLGKSFDGLAEKELSQKLICLPISPDYSTEDMHYLIETVTALMT